MKDTDGSLKYFLTDHLGSVVAITDDQGNLISQQRYLPFGAVRTNVTSPNSPNTDYGYTGQRNLDEDIGLMDYKFRFYSPTLGRFILPDNIVPDPNKPQKFNRYSYVENRPINFNDPTGHCSSDISILLPAFSAIKCFIEDTGDAIDAYNAGASTSTVIAKATGFDDWARKTGDKVNSLNADMSVILSNAPASERLSASYNVGTWAVNIANSAYAIGSVVHGAYLSAAAKARAWQGNGTYSGVDNWVNKILPKGSYVWGTRPGPSNFYTNNRTIQLSGNNASKIYDGLQIKVNPELGYRPGITLFRVNSNIQIAESVALANKGISSGGFTQYYIPNYEKVLQPIFTLLIK